MGHISNPVLCQGDGEGWRQPQSEVITGQWPGGCDAGTKTEGFCLQTRWEEKTYSSKSHPFSSPQIHFFKKLKIMKDVKYSGKRRKKCSPGFILIFVLNNTRYMNVPHTADREKEAEKCYYLAIRVVRLYTIFSFPL